ncbi:hypothetical protein RIF29_36077 [Crotalaria pallida]|uniref:PB1 domain-containing protein n=1 Tax=Crotalaria pallida TaxID=3830 RepID=A0AAN9EAW9_CROPI
MENNYPYPSSYPESHESSPRSRDTDFDNPPPWDDNHPPPNYKPKFICSYGGKILPRAHLSYVGGDTKILSVDSHINFPSFLSKLSSLSNIPPENLTLKYQLPDEELDALISVTNDDDLGHLMHEYDRLYRASSRPARMRLFLFTNTSSNPNSTPISTAATFSSERDRFVQALNSGSVPVQTEPVKAQPVIHGNADFLFGLDKAVAPPPPPVAAVKVHDPVPEPVALQPADRGIRSDPNSNSIEIQRQLQHMRIAEGDQFRRRSEDGFAGDYYLQKLPEKVPPSSSPVTVPHHGGFFSERQFSGDVFPSTVTTAPGGIMDQHVYMVTAPGTFYHAPVVPPPVTQGYYAVQRTGSDVYREQALYNAMAPPPPPNKAAFSSTGLAPVRGSTYAEGYGVVRPALVPDNTGAATYAQVAYDSVSGRQVYYNAPGGMVHAPPYQGGSPAVSADMRSAGVSLGQDGKVVNKVTQGSV